MHRYGFKVVIFWFREDTERNDYGSGTLRRSRKNFTFLAIST